MSEAILSPEIVSEERTAEILAATANHEIKALSLLAMEPHTQYTPSTLRREVLSLTGSPMTALVRHSSFGAYCGDSFVPIGLVAKVHPDPDRMTYEITDEGARVGKALAGHVLDLSLHAPEDISLRRIFGMTHSKVKSERPPYRRFEIYTLLLATDWISTADIFTRIGQDADYSTSYHRAETLVDDGMVNGVLVQPRGSRYKVDDITKLDNMYMRKKGTGISKDVNLAIKDIADISPQTEFWTRELFDHSTQALGYPENKQTYNNIRARMQYLLGANVVRLLSIEEGNSMNIQLKPELRSIVEEVVSIVKGLESGSEEFIREGLQKAHQILSSPDQVTLLIKKGMANSPQATSEYAQRAALNL